MMKPLLLMASATLTGVIFMSVAFAQLAPPAGPVSVSVITLEPGRRIAIETKDDLGDTYTAFDVTATVAKQKDGQPAQDMTPAEALGYAQSTGVMTNTP